MNQTPPPRHRSPLAARLHGVAVLNKLGPGLITGAADDDPSGIATYSQAGAQSGFGLLWTLALTFPLMVAIQMVSAQIGRVTGQGLAGEPVEFSGTGLLARCLQHETDHLHGTVFGDRLSDRMRKKLRKQMEAAAEDYPEGWPAQ